MVTCVSFGITVDLNNYGPLRLFWCRCGRLLTRFLYEYFWDIFNCILHLEYLLMSRVMTVIQVLCSELVSVLPHGE